MALQKKQSAKTPTVIDGQDDTTKGKLPGNSTIGARLKELESLPHRNVVLHWAAFTLSLLSLIILSAWVFSSRGSVPRVLVLLDIGLGVVFAVEFFTRSGFRWNWATYLRTRFFDFVAIVPALALVHTGSPWREYGYGSSWLRALPAQWIGFSGWVHTTQCLGLVEGFEESITDRVLERIIARIQADMDRAGFSHGVAEAFVRNKAAVLQRVRAATPSEGLVPSLAHIVGLDAA